MPSIGSSLCTTVIKSDGGFGIQIPVVIEWFIATGRDHPVWAVTWKMGEAANPQNRNFDDYRMDVRGPYGSLNFDGAANPTRATRSAVSPGVILV